MPVDIVQELLKLGGHTLFSAENGFGSHEMKVPARPADHSQVLVSQGFHKLGTFKKTSQKR